MACSLFICLYIVIFVMPLTDAERARRYRAAKKLRLQLLPKSEREKSTLPLTGAERCRRYRAAKKRRLELSPVSLNSFTVAERTCGHREAQKRKRDREAKERQLQEEHAQELAQLRKSLPFFYEATAKSKCKRRERICRHTAIREIPYECSTTSNLLVLDNNGCFIDINKLGLLGITEEEATSLVKAWVQQLMQLQPNRLIRAINAIAYILNEEKSDAPESLHSESLLYRFSPASECIDETIVTNVPDSIRTTPAAFANQKKFVSATTFGSLDALCDDSSKDSYLLDKLQQKLELEPNDSIESDNKCFSNRLLQKALNTPRGKQNIRNIELKVEVEPTVITEQRLSEELIKNHIPHNTLNASPFKSNTCVPEMETSNIYKTKLFQEMSPASECSNVSDWAIKVEPPDDLNDQLASDNTELMVKVTSEQYRR